MHKTTMAVAGVFALAGLLSGCATTQQAFYSSPSTSSLNDLCHAYVQTSDERYRADLATEIGVRGADLQACAQKARADNVAATAAAVVVTGALAIAASQSGARPAPYFAGGAVAAVAWDQFIENGFLISRCRDKTSGQFVDDYLWSGPPNDLTWPGSYV